MNKRARKKANKGIYNLKEILHDLELCAVYNATHKDSYVKLEVAPHTDLGRANPMGNLHFLPYGRKPCIIIGDYGDMRWPEFEEAVKGRKDLWIFMTSTRSGASCGLRPLTQRPE